jgi:Flp pilus assembly protein TadD
MKTYKIMTMLLGLIVALYSDKLNTIDVHTAWDSYPSATTENVGNEKIIFPSLKKINALNYKNVTLIKKEKLIYLDKYSKKTIANDPDNYNTYLDIGIVYAQNRFYEKSLEYFSRAVQLNNNSCKTYNNIANIYYLTGDNETAIKFYKKALQLKKNDPTTLLNLAFIQYDNGKFKLAKRNYLTAILLDPTIDREEYKVLASQSGTTKKASNKGVKKMRINWSKNK